MVRFCSWVFGSALLVALAFGDSSVTIYPQQPLQRIDGFGASDAWYASEIHSFNATQQAAILTALFSPTKGAGLSLLRHRVPPEIEPSAGVWDWTQDNDAVWLSKQAMALGVTRVWSTVWSPPAWMKSNNNVNNAGNVTTNHYQDYATFLATYCNHYSSVFGVPISGISIANEPDINASYESSSWDSQQFHDFIAGYLKPTFQSSNVKAQVMMPELSGWSDYAAAATLADPVTAGFVGIVNAHDYSGTLSPFLDAQAFGKSVWETEVSNLGKDDPSITDGLAWAQTIHHTLVDAQANAWHYWWLYADTTDTTGQSLISGTPSSNTWVAKKRLWTIGNFSRFVRPGWHLLQASSYNPESGVYVSSYVGNVGALAIVAINANSTSTQLSVNTSQPNPNPTYEYRTSATENLAYIGTLVTRLHTFTATLAPNSVTTFTVPSPLMPVAP